MSTTRSSLARKVLAGAAAPAMLVALAACGDDDDSAGGDDSAGADFCDGANDLQERFADTNVDDAEQITEIGENMAALDPPGAIADDWETMVAAYEALAEVDLNDPEAVNEIQQDPQFENFEQAVGNVSTYLEDECGMEGAGN